MTEWLLKKFGAHYILVMMILTRPICLVGGGLTIYYINLTMNLDALIFNLLIFYSSILIPAATALTVFMALRETRTLRKVLGRLFRNEKIDTYEGEQAGREAVVFPRVHHRREAIYVTFICVVLFCFLLVFVNLRAGKVAFRFRLPVCENCVRVDGDLFRKRTLDGSCHQPVITARREN